MPPRFLAAAIAAAGNLIQHQGSVFRPFFPAGKCASPLSADTAPAASPDNSAISTRSSFLPFFKFCFPRPPFPPPARLIAPDCLRLVSPRLPQSAQLTVPNRCRLVSAAVCPVGSRKTSYKNSITQKKAAVNRKKALALDKILCYY